MLSSEEKPLYDNYTDNSDIIVYQDFFERQIVAAMIITAAVSGIVGNSFVVVAVAAFTKLRTTTNAFVVNLAVSDVLTCLFMPWQAVAILGRNGWPLPGARWLCTLAAFVVVVTIGCSVNNLALIAMNRWVGITKSRATTRRIYSARKLALMLIISWAIPLCCALTPVLTDFGELGYEELYSTCSWDTSNPYAPYFNLLITAVFYPIQLTVIIVSYTSVFCYVRKTSREMAQADAPSRAPDASATSVAGGAGNRVMKRMLWRRKVHVTRNLLYIVLAFIICLTPYAVALTSRTDWSYRMTPWAGAILFCNSCVNPFIYATSHPDFKKAFRHMILRSGHADPRSRGSSKPLGSLSTTSSEV